MSRAVGRRATAARLSGKPAGSTDVGLWLWSRFDRLWIGYSLPKFLGEDGLRILVGGQGPLVDAGLSFNSAKGRVVSSAP